MGEMSSTMLPQCQCSCCASSEIVARCGACGTAVDLLDLPLSNCKAICVLYALDAVRVVALLPLPLLLLVVGAVALFVAVAALSGA